MILFPCPNCRQRLQVPSDAAGTARPCLHCGQHLRIPSEIVSESCDLPIRVLHERYEKEKKLNLEPEFQRREVWDDKKASRLIESLLLRVPLPTFYFAEGEDGEWEVIDGQQRLRACFDFLAGSLILRELKELPYLNGKKHCNLDEEEQNLIRTSNVRVILFKKESDHDLRFRVFERLNTAAVSLNDQEIRNCIYRGPYNQLLNRLAENHVYLELTGFKNHKHAISRMKDVEYVLRFASFFHSKYHYYTPPMKLFLNKDMESFRQIDSEDQKKLESAFTDAARLVEAVFDKHAFRRFNPGKDGRNPDGHWERRIFNASLYDILMGVFADKDKDQVLERKDSILEAFIYLMSNNQEFVDSVSRSTSASAKVRARFRIWEQVLKNILESIYEQPRCFSRNLKQVLYQTDPRCAICKKTIKELDDAAVYDIPQYWLGEKPIPNDARLAHRYCNRSNTEVIIIDPYSCEEFTHTTHLWATVNEHDFDTNWNDLMAHLHVLAWKHFKSWDEFRQVSRANIRQGKDVGNGYIYVEEGDFSIQNEDANHAWERSFSVARKLNIPIKVQFEWRDKEGAAHPGQRGVVEWTPSGGQR